MASQSYYQAAFPSGIMDGGSKRTALPSKVRPTKLSVAPLAWAPLRREPICADGFLSAIIEERTLHFIKVCEVKCP